MYFFIWSLILGDIAVLPISLAPSKSLDSIDVTDQPLPIPSLERPDRYPGRSPRVGGSVFTDRLEDKILDGGIRSEDESLGGGNGGKPALSVLS